MKTALVQAKVDAEIKASAEEFFKNVGLDITTAIRMFLANVATYRELPFKVKEQTYKPEFVEKILRADKQYKDGNYIEFKDLKEMSDYFFKGAK
ncbi:ACP phosphodiesterase [Fibrobacterales bacterium]|nr:ACP phosphodiesterase [Fibrobacterales bacterium]